eukprot:TRINITY_DN12548_c0_g1_i1.p1 TRINITY_DN12548_c0_g1~~TRINITY_DN12548_c0_g1_i1.p1  ORF type:complete len:571 (-),score=146.42 TRINITY_DN12548_c0_g1_i1:20-1564(-)
MEEGFVLGYWGVAFVNGINYNDNATLADQKALTAKTYIDKALHLLTTRTYSALEVALVKALAVRCKYPLPDTELLTVQKTFSDEMRKVYHQFKDDVDVASIFAESLMLLTPWKLWKKTGEPTSEVTLEVKAILEEAIAKYPPHPAIYHLYIHLMELSSSPSTALDVSYTLEDLLPDSGHLVHMPSHIYIQTGLYSRAIDSNLKGIAADKKYVPIGGRHNFYTVYRLHNYHFVVYGAMLNGQFQLALDIANELITEIPTDYFISMRDWLESFVSLPLHVLVRFGKWEQILKYPFPRTSASPPPLLSLSELPVPEDPSFYAFTTSITHYARGLAFTNLFRIPEAEAERASLEETSAKIPPTRVLFNNTCTRITQIAKKMLDGEIHFRKGRLGLKEHNLSPQDAKVYEDLVALGLEELKEAVRLEDSLDYDEPWGWMQPIRHALGALSLEAGLLDQAEGAYKEDLARFPENCWSLVGLEECWRRKNINTDQILQRTTKAKERADVAINASCYCKCNN